MRHDKPKAARRKGRDEVEEGSGNVFADLEMPNPGEMLAKAELARRICDILAERKLTQTKAAAVLGVDQPKVSALMRGKLDGFSTDRLFRFLNALGRDVEIVIRPEKRTGEAKTRVTTSTG
jgi:predicted XRE-type DNA-binding protein